MFNNHSEVISTHKSLLGLILGQYIYTRYTPRRYAAECE